MADEIEGPDAGAEVSASGVDALALALEGASREESDALLRDQRAVLRNQNSLIDIQKHHLAEQFKQLRLNIWQQRMDVLLRIATGFIGLIVAAGLALMIWDAAHANGLIIESFSVPPDLASRGITGQVVASQMQDKLTAMQNATKSTRPPQSYANNWGDGIKVEIPTTGVSIGEAYRFLREWLGRETHVTGEVYRTATGTAVTARTGTDVGGTYVGSETDLDQLLQKAAEHVYGSTQPFRYGTYLHQHNRDAEADAIFQAEAATGPAEERAWGYFGQFNGAGGPNADFDIQYRLLQPALALDPDNRSVLLNIRVLESYKGMLEEALRDEKKLMSLIATGDDHANTPDYYRASKVFNPANINQYTGAWHDMALATASIVQQYGSKYNTEQPAVLARAEVSEHDLAAARRTYVGITPETENTNADRSDAYKLRLRMWMAADTGDWVGVLARENALMRIEQRSPPVAGRDVALVVPMLALARAELGDSAGAEARIAATPVYCNPCLIARAQVAEIASQRARADWWFDQAVKDGPSIPFADAAWGAALLERGQPDAAIEKFKLANRKGPHFADPLEMWGEALMAKNRSDLALAKFAEAERYAPNWGRLHLKWGEALGYAGKKNEARAQYRAASALDLSLADKAELARELRG